MYPPEVEGKKGKHLTWEDRLIYTDKTWGEIPDCIDVEKEILEKRIFDFKHDLLETAFNELSDLQKDILIMLYLKDMKPVEIAEILNCSIPQVYKQKNKALCVLRNELVKGGGKNE